VEGFGDDDLDAFDATTTRIRQPQANYAFETLGA
jgi:hypothetical protein